ncbi:MAG: hypothetical protein JW725_00380 [Candidatus Babeliaceae bacterium]|nr:hypothetical protein [Candidatus Babeliaceae bacterium]
MKFKKLFPATMRLSGKQIIMYVGNIIAEKYIFCPQHRTANPQEQSSLFNTDLTANSTPSTQQQTNSITNKHNCKTESMSQLAFISRLLYLSLLKIFLADFYNKYSRNLSKPGKKT